MIAFVLGAIAGASIVGVFFYAYVADYRRRGCHG
jgi:hypothetical protein